MVIPMKFYGLTPISNFIDNRRIKSFHANMFHGLAERDGKEVPHDTKVFANTEVFRPLLISRTGRHVPDFCEPSTHFVVCERLARQLDGLPNIRLAPVVFKRLVDVEYQKGDMTWAEKWGNVDPRQLLRTLPDVPDFHKTIGCYFEVQAYRWRDVIDKYPLASEITIEELTPPLQETSVIRLSAQMLEDFPILCYGTKIISETAFQLLAENIDREFFIVREYHL